MIGFEKLFDSPAMALLAHVLIGIIAGFLIAILIEKACRFIKTKLIR